MRDGVDNLINELFRVPLCQTTTPTTRPTTVVSMTGVISIGMKVFGSDILPVDLYIKCYLVLTSRQAPGFDQ